MSVVLVTGAGSGIGEAVARSFLSAGADVVLAGRRPEALARVAADAAPDRVLTVPVDLGVPGASDTLVEQALTRFGQIDTVVSSAGTSMPSPVGTFSRDDWARLRAVNLDAVVELAHAVAAPLRASRGSLTVVSSVAGLRGEWGMSAYGATKGAVNVLVQGLALDLGRDGVRVNAVAPGFTVTRLTQDRLDDQVFLDRLLDRVALDRVGSPEDVAQAVRFLAGPEASYITGVVLPVDGGISASDGVPRPL